MAGQAPLDLAAHHIAQPPVAVPTVVEHYLRVASAGEVSDPDGMLSINQIAETSGLAGQAPLDLDVDTYGVPSLHDGLSCRGAVEFASVVGGEVSEILELGRGGKSRIEQRCVPDMPCHIPRIPPDGDCGKVEGLVRNPRVDVHATEVA